MVMEVEVDVVDRLKKKRSTLKGGITRNQNKAKTIIAEHGSRKVLRNSKVRIKENYSELCSLTEQLLLCYDKSEVKKLESEMWLAEVKEQVEEIVDEIDAHLEERLNETESSLSFTTSRNPLLRGFRNPLIADHSDVSSNSSESVSHLSAYKPEEFDNLKEESVDAKVAALKVRQEKLLHDQQISMKTQEARLEEERARLEKQREKDEIARQQLKEELLFKRETNEISGVQQGSHWFTRSEVGSGVQSALGKGNKETAMGHSDLKEMGSIFKGLQKPQLTKFSGDKELYHDWRAQFDIFIDQTDAPAKLKMMMLKNSLSGKPLKVIERLGYTDTQYKAALSKLDLKFGGEKRLLQRQLDNILQHAEVSEDNLKQLEIFSDHLSDIVSKLEDHGQLSELTGVSTLYSVVQSKMPKSMLVSYQQWVHDNKKDDGMQTFSGWLAEQVVYRVEAEETRGQKRDQRRATGRKSGSFQAAKRVEQKTCPLCNAKHKITACQRWIDAPVADRWGVAKTHSLCYRCLESGHPGSECESKNRCNIDGCEKTHHFHLHFVRTAPSRPQPAPPPPQETRQSNTVIAEKELTAPGSVLLRTVPVWVSVEGEKRIKVNAFLDDGSDTSYIREDVVTALGIRAEDSELTLTTLTDKNAKVKSKAVKIEIASLDSETKRKIDVWSMEELCHGMIIPDWSRHQQKWDHLKGLQFQKVPGRKTIDILIGADHPELALALEERVGEQGEPVARRTPLGWTCVGRVPSLIGQRTSAHARTFNAQAVPNVVLDDQLRSMWDMDTLGEKNEDEAVWTPEEKLAVEKTETSMKRVGDRYEVGIPWKGDVVELPDNRELAQSRLDSLEKSLRRRPEIAEKYREAMNANVEKGYVRKLEREEVENEDSYYLAHFPVIREDKETTKVRIVLDSKAKFKGACLNDAMLTGPKLQRDILEVLLRFREKPVALVGDIKEMFPQVVLAENDRRYHRLLWRDLETDREPDVYEATRLVFGDRASPFLAQFVMRRHAEELRDEYKLAAPVVLERIYMDDILDSEETVCDAVKAREELVELLGRAGFQIRRWCSNSAQVLEGVPMEERASGVKLDECELPSVKTLGVQWDANTDEFSFAVNQDATTFEFTKRGLLSRVATLFDPLQMAAPYVIRAKMALQEAWLEGLDWDEEFPERLKATVEGWLDELDRLDGVRIPRCYRSGKEYRNASLHTFTDASKLAYAAVTYVRFENEDGSFEVSFVAAKAKVTPIRAISIPRLELMAAGLGLKLAEGVSRILDIPLSQHTFWSDSMDVIYWIRGQSRRYKPFVANRVSSIHEKTSPHQWRHVPGKENSADDATRGLSIEELNREHRWFRGPEFLQEGESEWPKKRSDSIQQSEEAEKETNKVSSVYSSRQKKKEQLLDPEKYSSWMRLLRVTAYVLRFIAKLKKKREKKTEKSEAAEESKSLTVEEIVDAEKYWIGEVQRREYSEEFESLKKEGVKNKGNLRQLSPFVDQEGIIRVGGRLENSSLPYDAKHPVILPKSDWISYLIVTHTHRKAGHSCGTNHVLAEVRQKYWIIHGRELIKRVKRECNLCKIVRKKTGEQVMAPLPKARLGDPMRCFARCCVDYGGPYTVKLTRRVTAKRYLCLFTCAATRAVHLEVAYSLDTDSFLDACSRMVARRGKPEVMISDNGSNFTAADKELRALVAEIDQDKVTEMGASEGIEWQFNPPTGSHHGGVFESLIKSSKRSIRAILGDAGITDEELLTAIVEVEGLMNSRPLSYVSDDPEDDAVLTPNHFLYGQAGGQLAPKVIDEVAFNPRNRWRFVQDLVHKSWKRWMKEYLTTLNTRGKWTELKKDASVGDVVLMVDQKNPRGKWPLARVTEVYPGPDGHVRVVDVISKGKVYRRPVTRLCPLEL